MPAPTIEEIREVSDRTTDRLIELERRRQARTVIPDPTDIAQAPTNARSFPWAIALAAAGLGVGLGAAVVLAWVLG